MISVIGEKSEIRSLRLKPEIMYLHSLFPFLFDTYDFISGKVSLHKRVHISPPLKIYSSDSTSFIKNISVTQNSSAQFTVFPVLCDRMQHKRKVHLSMAMYSNPLNYSDLYKAFLQHSSVKSFPLYSLRSKLDVNKCTFIVSL